MRKVVIILLIAVCVQCALSAVGTPAKRTSKGNTSTKRSVKTTKKSITSKIEKKNSDDVETEKIAINSPPAEKAHIPSPDEPMMVGEIASAPAIMGKLPKSSTIEYSKNGSIPPKGEDDVKDPKKNPAKDIKDDVKDLKKNSTKSGNGDVKDPMIISCIEGNNGVIKRDGEIIVQDDDDFENGIITVFIGKRRMYVNNKMVCENLPASNDPSFNRSIYITPAGLVTSFQIQIRKDTIVYTDNTGTKRNIKIRKGPTSPNSDDDDEEGNSTENSEESVKDPMVVSLIEGKDGVIKRDGKIIRRDDDDFQDGKVSVFVSKRIVYLNGKSVYLNLPVTNRSYNRAIYINPVGEITSFKIQIRKDDTLLYTDDAGNEKNIKI